jgi:hypothetical protein
MELFDMWPRPPTFATPPTTPDHDHDDDDDDEGEVSD